MMGVPTLPEYKKDLRNSQRVMKSTAEGKEMFRIINMLKNSGAISDGN
jgi:hypothetical protein